MLHECIGSILSQIVDAEVEIIVHDDASVDESLSVLRESFPSVKVIASKHNVGFCKANNRMVEAASGDYVLLLNNDAALDQSALITLLAARRRLAQPCVLTLPQHDWDTGALVDRGCLLDPFNNPVPNLDAKSSDVAYVIGACLWIDRALWERLGGFPEWFGSIGEDLYLCGKARLQGVPVRAIEGSAYRHRQGKSFGGNRVERGWRTTILRRGLSELNKTHSLVVLTPTFFAWPLLTLHLLALSAEGVLLSVLKQDISVWTKVYWPAISYPFVHLKMLRAERRDVQLSRKITLVEWFSVTSWQLRKLSMLSRFGLPKIE